MNQPTASPQLRRSSRQIIYGMLLLLLSIVLVVVIYKVDQSELHAVSATAGSPPLLLTDEKYLELLQKLIQAGVPMGQDYQILKNRITNKEVEVAIVSLLAIASFGSSIIFFARFFIPRLKRSA